MFNWAREKQRARRVVHNIFSGPAIYKNKKTGHQQECEARLISKVEWAGTEGAEYQTENRYVYVDAVYLDNLFRGDTVTLSTGEVVSVENTLPKKDGLARAMVTQDVQV